MPAKQFTCPTCGKVTTKYIYPGKPASDYCSIECKLRFTSKKCEHCGKEFRVKPSDFSVSKYCSQRCYHKAKTNGKTFYSHTCIICHRPYQSLRESSTFCSLKCLGQSRKKGQLKICQGCGKQFYIRPSRNYRIYCSDQCYESDHNQSSLERTICNLLDSLSIPYTTQYRIERFWIDIAFPDYKLAVECDGIYWHSFSNSHERDRRKDKAIKKYGWRLLRFTENEIRTSAQTCVNQIIKHIRAQA